MESKTKLKPHNMKIGDKKSFKTQDGLWKFIADHETKNGEFASGFDFNDMSKDCWLKKME